MSGMLQIVRFNWPWYAAGVAASTMGWVVLPCLSRWPWPRELALAGLAGAIWFMVSSLVVSGWVYDGSVLRRWTWIRQRLPKPPATAANIHAGFDETSRALVDFFPRAQIAVWDIYQPALTTEGSIARARRLQNSPPSARKAEFSHLPEGDGVLDAVFLLFAAHEIRSGRARDEFFGELFRILKPSGTVLITEHLRDWKNFLAFGPGFLHFLPRQEWVRLAKNAGFLLAEEFSITPFVRVFRLVKPTDL
jgi:SAM-dependent methyltransferase